MERLTDKRLTKACNDPWDYCGLDNVCARNCQKPTPCKLPKMIRRLAEIEDILGDNYDLNRLEVIVNQCMTMREEVYERFSITKNISVDRLRELAQAVREGTCGIPPVKLHQQIFRVFNGKIIKETVCSATWEPFTPRPRWKVGVMGGGSPYYWRDVFGKTVFLTREAAEGALKGEQDG